MDKITLLKFREGPLVQIGTDGVLYVEDLNPHVETKWRMSRWELLSFGVRTVCAALFAKRY